MQVMAAGFLMIVMMVVANPAKGSIISETHSPLPWLQKLALTGIFALQFYRPVLDSAKAASVDERTDRIPFATLTGIVLVFKCCFGVIGAYLIELKLNGAIFKDEA